jgi:hypothetical protein
VRTYIIEDMLVTGYCYGVVSYKNSHATATIFWSIVLPIWVLIIPDSSTRLLCSGYSRYLIAKRGETWREVYVNFACISVIPQGIFNVPQNLTTWGPTALLPLRRKSCYWFLSPLKMNHFRPGLNQRTLDPMASMITISTPTMTYRLLN